MKAHARLATHRRARSTRATLLTAALAHVLALACLILLVRSQTAAAGTNGEVPASAICHEEYVLSPEDARCSKMPCSERSVNSFFNRYGPEIKKKMERFCANPSSATSAKKVTAYYFDVCRETCDTRSNEGTYEPQVGAKKFKRDCVRACGRNHDFMMSYVHGVTMGGNCDVRTPASSSKPKIDAPSKAKKLGASKKSLAVERK